MAHIMMVNAHQVYQHIVRCMVQGIHGRCFVHQLAPGINMGCLAYHSKLVVDQHSMFTCDEVMPFPCLAAQECQSANNGPGQPFDHTLFIVVMTCMHCQYHGNGTDDQDKGHYTNESQWEIGMSRAGKSIEYHVRVCPEILGKTNGTIRDEEGSECE